MIAAALSLIFTVDIGRRSFVKLEGSWARGRIVSRRKFCWLAGAKVLLRNSLGREGRRETDAAASVRVHILETRGASEALLLRILGVCSLSDEPNARRTNP